MKNKTNIILIGKATVKNGNRVFHSNKRINKQKKTIKENEIYIITNPREDNLILEEKYKIHAELGLDEKLRMCIKVNSSNIIIETNKITSMMK